MRSCSTTNRSSSSSCSGSTTSPVATPEPAPTADEVMDSIEKRIAAAAPEHPTNPRYRSLAERLESLRQAFIETAEESIDVPEAAARSSPASSSRPTREQVAEEGAAAVAGTTPSRLSLLPDQRIGRAHADLRGVQARRDARDRRARRATRSTPSSWASASRAGRPAARATAPSSSRSARRFKKYGIEPDRRALRPRLRLRRGALLGSG